MKRRYLTEDDIKDGITYDKVWRMNYHPEFHPNHKQPFDEEELEYISKFYQTDGALAISLALGRTEGTIKNKYSELSRSGKLDYYRSLNHYV